MKKTEILWAFLKARRWRIVSGVCCLGLTAIVAAVWQLPMVPVVCLIGLCFLCLLGFWMVEGMDFAHRYRWIRGANSCDFLSETSAPKPADSVEASYRSLLLQMENEKQSLREAFRQEKSEQAEYYALWAHQIKTPLSAMRLLLQGVPIQQREEMYAELFRIEQYADMALSYQRLFSDNQELVLKKYSLQTIVKGTVRKYARLFVQKDIQLQMGPLEGTVVTDEKWLGFAIGQILSNAVAFTPEGGRVVLAKEEPYTLLIADSGVGIEPEDLPRVFEKGYTGSKAPREKTSAGIGLYMTQKALTLMGHSIDIQSRPGRGTLVKLQLDNHLPKEKTDG